MAVGPDMQITAQTLEATKTAAVATLAAALITAASRPHSVDEAIKLMRDIQWSLWPSSNYGAYKDWKKDFKGNEPHK